LTWKPPWINEFKENNHRSRMTLVVRHSEKDKHELESPFSDVHLTSKGIDMAFTVGREVSFYKDIRIFTSPITRCVETSKSIIEGYGQDCEVIESNMLGKHGPFVLDPSVTSRKMEELGDDFVGEYFKYNIDQEVMLSPDIGTIRFMPWLISKYLEKEKGLDIHISHDLIVTSFLFSIVDYNVLSKGLVDYLDGFLVYSENGRYYLNFRGHEVDIYHYLESKAKQD